MSHNIKNQQGISLVSAIFILVILALLGVGMVRLLTSSQQAVSQEITSLEAYLAAQSGLQWAMYQAVYASPANGDNHTLNFTTNNITSDVTFALFVNQGKNYYRINSNGAYSKSSPQNPEYSMRKLQLRFVP